MLGGRNGLRWEGSIAVQPATSRENQGEVEIVRLTLLFLVSEALSKALLALAMLSSVDIARKIDKIEIGPCQV